MTAYVLIQLCLLLCSICVLFLAVCNVLAKVLAHRLTQQLTHRLDIVYCLLRLYLVYMGLDFALGTAVNPLTSFYLSATL